MLLFEDFTKSLKAFFYGCDVNSLVEENALLIFGIRRLEKENADLAKQKATYINSLIAKEDQIEHLTGQLNENTAQVDVLIEERQELSTQISKLTEDLIEAGLEQERRKSENIKLRKELLELAELNRAAISHNDELRVRVQDLKIEIESINKGKENLVLIIETYKPYYHKYHNLTKVLKSFSHRIDDLLREAEELETTEGLS